MLAVSIDNTQNEEAEPWDLLAQALGGLSEIEDDKECLNLQEGFRAAEEADDRFGKVPLEQASNLLTIRRAARDLKAGVVTVDKYAATLRPFLQPLASGLKLLHSPTVQHQLEQLPEEQLAVFNSTHQHLLRLSEGLKIMYSFKSSGDLAAVDAGLFEVELALVALDATQDEAIDIGREADLRESMAA